MSPALLSMSFIFTVRQCEKTILTYQNFILICNHLSDVVLHLGACGINFHLGGQYLVVLNGSAGGNTEDFLAHHSLELV